MKMGRRGKPGSVPHMVQKGHAFYHVPGSGDRNWTPLGSNRAAALIQWAELEGRSENATLEDLFLWFMSTAKIADNTRKNYEIQGAKCMRVFGHMSPDSITAYMLAEYRDKCPPGTANVRIGLLKTIYAAAREKGKCATNPARDVKRLARVTRKRLINDAEFIAVGSVAADFCRIAMDIIYQIGCRPGDSLKIKLTEISDAGILFTAQKTGKKTLYRMTPDLAATIAEAKALPRLVKSLYLLGNDRGQPYTLRELEGAWNAACRLAGVEGAQIRDIRAKNASDDPAGAQERLQHSDKSMTRGYIRSTPVVSPLPRRIAEGSTSIGKKSN